MIRVWPRHMKAIGKGYCAKGARAFAIRNNLDFQKFVHEGIPEELLIATGDAMAMVAVEKAREEWAAKTIHPQ